MRNPPLIGLSVFVVLLIGCFALITFKGVNKCEPAPFDPNDAIVKTFQIYHLNPLTGELVAVGEEEGLYTIKSVTSDYTWSYRDEKEIKRLEIILEK